MAHSPLAIDPSMKADPPYDGWKGLPNAFLTISILLAILVFLGGFGVAAGFPRGLEFVALIAAWCGGWLSCLMLYAVGAIIATLRAINHNLYVIGQREP